MTHPHLIKSSSTHPIPLTTIREGIMTTLNNFYDGTGISFKCIGEETIISDALNKAYGSDIGLVFSKNPHDNAVDIYVQTLTSYGIIQEAGGVAETIPSLALIIPSINFNSSILCHEMGHCLGLYHTHHGTDIREGGIPELVNGSNSATAGDFVTDTPADPNVWDNGTNYGYDANGDPYAPDFYNIMSYNDPIFLTNITYGQVSRIYRTVSLNSTIAKAVTKTPISITGSDIISPLSTQKYSFTNNVNDAKWTVECLNYKTKSETERILTSSEGANLDYTNNITSGLGQRFTITGWYESTRGFTFGATKNAYSSNLSSETLTLSYTSTTLGGTIIKTGTIDLDNSQSQTIPITQGGILQFRISDVICPVSNYATMSLWMDGFSAVTGNKFYFKCASNASIGLRNSPLNITLGTKTKMVPLKVNVTSSNGTTEVLPVDSLMDIDDELTGGFAVIQKNMKYQQKAGY